MKRKFMLPFLLLLAVVFSGCGMFPNTAKTDTAEPAQMPEEESEYPKIVYLDGVLYYGTDEKCEVVPRRAPDGMIETFVDKEIMPDAPVSANFGSEQGKLEYMLTEDGRLMVHIGEDWFYFTTTDESSAAVQP